MLYNIIGNLYTIVQKNGVLLILPLLFPYVNFKS